MSSFLDILSPRLLSLFPQLLARPEPAQLGWTALLEAEEARRGRPDPLSGCYHALALTQGSLLKEEYDASTHSFSDAWTLDAWVVDPVEFMLVNQRLGFTEGDRVLAALGLALRSLCPTAKCVRLHSDAFALLLGPTSGLRLEDVSESALRATLAQVPEVERWTLGAVRLQAVSPSHWQLLGPWVWAECERRLVLAKQTPASGPLLRRVDFQGRLPKSD